MYSSKNRKGERKGRDNFSQAVLKILCRRAGGKCCKCGANTLGPVTNNPYQSVNIGKGAHIAAAAPGGPRYDRNMSPEERSSATNGLWLCSNCHDQIDRDSAGYPTSALHAMKKQAEQRVRKELGVATVLPPNSNAVSPTALIAGVSAAAILEIRQAKSKFLESLSRDNALAQAEVALSDVCFLDVEADQYAEEVGKELMLLLQQVVGHCKEPTVTLEVIRRLKSIAERFHREWREERVQLMCDVIKVAMHGGSSSKRSRVFQSGLALQKDLSMYSTLKERKLHTIPQDVIKKMRATREETDAGPPTKRPRRGDGLQEEEADEMDKYLELMEELVVTSDPDKTLEIEGELETMGYVTYVQ